MQDPHVSSADETQAFPVPDEFAGGGPEFHLAAPLIIWAIDSHGTLTLSEGAGLRTLGLHPGESAGQPVEDVYREAPELLTLIRDALAGRRFFATCHVDHVEYETRCAPLRDQNGDIVGVLGVSVEIAPDPNSLTDSGQFAGLYRQLTQPLPIITYIAECRSPYCRIYISSQFETVVGWPARTWLENRQSWLKNVHPEDRTEVLSHLQRAVDETRIVENSFRLIGAAGQVIFVEERVVAVRSAEGMPLCLQGVLLDVTARKLAENKFAHSDQYLRLIVESACDGIFTVDRNGRFNYVNPRIAQMLEIAEDQLLARHFNEFLLPEDRVRMTEQFERRMLGMSEPRAYEIQLQTLLGTTFWAEVDLTPLKVADHFTGSLAFVRDITRRKHVENSLAEFRSRLEHRVAERTRDMRLANQVLEEQIELARAVTRQLQTSEARWRSLVEHAPQYVMLLDKDGRLMFMNRVAPGFNMEDVVGSNLLDLIPEQNHAFTRRILRRVFIDAEPETYEIDGFGPHGTVAWYSISIGPIIGKPGEPPTTAVLIAADITERKATEEALQKRQQELTHIARLNTMGALTAELAHELNQPLEAISAYADACLRSLSGGQSESERVETALRSISLQSSRAGQIIRKIMDFLRKTDLPRQSTDMNRLIRDVVEFLDLEGRKHQVNFECDLSSELPEIDVNRVQIEQVLFNLLFNAVDAVRMTELGSRNIRVTSRPKGNGDVEISVFDEGCGFNPAQVDELFQPFYSTKGHGMGMGLSISRTIVDEHGGRIWANSQEGKGTTFTVVLPASCLRPEALETPLANETEPPGDDTELLN